MGRNESSFRDPLGYIFRNNSKVYRHVTPEARDDYELLMSSGLYEELTQKGMLIPHKEVRDPRETAGGAYKVLLPDQLAVITYPYEWSFSHYRDAALLTTKIQKTALSYGMTLKDASAYNVQLHQGRQVFIDTLSFTSLKTNYWDGYKQFCEHFLAPLLLMSTVDVRMGLMMRDFIDGIPLDLAVKLLPARVKARPGVLTHVVAHSAAQQNFAAKRKAIPNKVDSKLSPTRLIATADSLERLVGSLSIPKKAQTEWHKYYEFTNYSDMSFKEKKKVIRKFTAKVLPDLIIDAGGNDGTFVREALSIRDCLGIAADIDPLAVEQGYRLMQQKGEQNFLPIKVDLTNPSPGIGWANSERQPLTERLPGKKQLVFALALIHHLSISNNVPFPEVASYLASLGEYLVIEFVPKGDSKVDILLTSREDIFPDYTQEGFEAAFSKIFIIQNMHNVRGSKRVMYLMKRRSR